MMFGWPYCLSWFRIFSRMKGPSWVAKRKTSGQVLSTVERANDEVSIGVMESANSVGCTHLRLSEVKAVVGGNGNGVAGRVEIGDIQSVIVEPLEHVGITSIARLGQCRQAEEEKRKH